MKLLIVTQKINRNDPILGFFHGWIIEFVKHFESITVICLEKGEYNLPTNVKVLSLGKESGISRSKYLFNFYKYIWQERSHYDVVFVHMNQEYILLGGIFWYLFGKKIYMWRNHHAGSFLTDIAAKFCKKVFCTSRFSYTAKYKKAVLMPVGINLELFKKNNSINRVEQSVLFLGRMAPIKRPDLLICAFAGLKKQNLTFRASFYGDPLPKDVDYYNNLKQMVTHFDLQDSVKFYSGIPNEQTVRVYNGHEIFMNLSTSGMYDKTIFEAMACGCLILASNNNLKNIVDHSLIFNEGDLNDLQEKLKYLLNLNFDKKNKILENLSTVTFTNSLKELAIKLEKELSLS